MQKELSSTTIKGTQNTSKTQPTIITVLVPVIGIPNVNNN